MSTANKNVTIHSYIAGFVLSVVLTLAAYAVAQHHMLAQHSLLIGLGVLAFTQCLVQLLFFLHLGNETRPRWKLLVFIFMVGVVIIIVVGSIWIMDHLNTHMTSDQMNKYLHGQDGL